MSLANEAAYLYTYSKKLMSINNQLKKLSKKVNITLLIRGKGNKHKTILSKTQLQKGPTKVASLIKKHVSSKIRTKNVSWILCTLTITEGRDKFLSG